ncbi:hypothetical protein CALVIDRAFT_601480 [Calocera viscosa TUFC12733]|uniref:Hydrophobin n=1 Tax=Calocera viscosa (strain TUFC12733) TaxID=1330018 RepID=A0A167IBI2_CALVF|nr:hypothetical protein CALVIDRAFT_601480 [Calocera viscosa TUFC12733]
MFIFLRMLLGLSVLLGILAAPPGALSGRLDAKGITNAERFASGLPPARPNRLYDPTRVPTALKSRSSVVPSTCSRTGDFVFCCEYVGPLSGVDQYQFPADYLAYLEQFGNPTVCLGVEQLPVGETVCPSPSSIGACCEIEAFYGYLRTGLTCNAP